MRLPLQLQILFVLMVCFLQIRPIDDMDIFTQIKLGQQSLAQFNTQVPEQFSYALVHKLVPNPGWLAQVVYALIHQFGSWEGLKILHAILFCSCFILAATSALKNWAPDRPRVVIVIAAIMLGFLVSLSNSSVRPQIFSFLGFVLLQQVLNSCRRGKITGYWWFALAVTGLIWSNSHPSLGVGLILVGCYLLDLLPQYSSQRRAIFQLLLIAAFLFFAQFITPLGLQIINVSSTNVEISRWLGVSEWSPAWHPSVRAAMFGFWLALALSLFIIIPIWRKISRLDLILFLCFGVLTLSASRFAVYFALVMIPVWIRWLESIVPEDVFAWPLSYPSSNFGIYIITALVGAGALNYGSAVKILDPQLPLAAIERLQQNISQGNIFNYREWGGIVTFMGFPKWKVHIDGRLYLYPKQYWVEYNQISTGTSNLPEIITKYKIDGFILHNRFHLYLIEQLSNLDTWQELWADQNSHVFIRRAINKTNFKP